MAHRQTTDSHFLCPTCQGDVSDKKDLDYFVKNCGPHKSDDVPGLYEEVNTLVRLLGALAQAGPRAVAESEDVVDHEWTSDLAWLAEELAEETRQRLLLLEKAGCIWRERAEQSLTRKEG